MERRQAYWAKPPLKLQEIWAIRIRLQLAKNTRDLALFNLAFDCKLRACDLVKLGVADIALRGSSATTYANRATKDATTRSVWNNRKGRKGSVRKRNYYHLLPTPLILGHLYSPLDLNQMRGINQR